MLARNADQTAGPGSSWTVGVCSHNKYMQEDELISYLLINRKGIANTLGWLINVVLSQNDKRFAAFVTLL